MNKRIKLEEAAKTVGMEIEDFLPLLRPKDGRFSNLFVYSEPYKKEKRTNPALAGANRHYHISCSWVPVSQLSFENYVDYVEDFRVGYIVVDIPIKVFYQDDEDEFPRFDHYHSTTFNFSLSDIYIESESLRTLLPECFTETEEQTPEDTIAALKEEVAQLRKRLQAAEEKGLDNGLGLILDDTYEYHAPELALAMKAWLAIYSDPENVRPSTQKKDIREKALELSPKKPNGKSAFSGTALDNIAKIANPNKAGGAPPTP
ncbi:MAG: hypothetical protein CSA26_03450 [Desulfobacterales bacterium]|nr:MAG: hypothetical protein CSA26_03450 [Desulfobacterales bacterium]